MLVLARQWLRKDEDGFGRQVLPAGRTSGRPARTAVATSTPHSHRWDFASWVAVGPGLLETYFTKTESSDPAGSAHVHYDYGREAEH